MTFLVVYSVGIPLTTGELTPKIASVAPQPGQAQGILRLRWDHHPSQDHPLRKGIHYIQLVVWLYRRQLINKSATRIKLELPPNLKLIAICLLTTQNGLLFDSPSSITYSCCHSIITPLSSGRTQGLRLFVASQAQAFYSIEPKCCEHSKRLPSHFGYPLFGLTPTG
jgi:hypothetical protein